MTDDDEVLNDEGTLPDEAALDTDEEALEFEAELPAPQDSDDLPSLEALPETLIHLPSLEDLLDTGVAPPVFSDGDLFAVGEAPALTDEDMLVLCSEIAFEDWGQLVTEIPGDDSYAVEVPDISIAPAELEPALDLAAVQFILLAGYEPLALLPVEVNA